MTDVANAATVADLDVLSLVRASILVTDRDGTILRAHGGAGRPLGYSPEQLIGHNGIEFIAPQDHEVMASMSSEAEKLPILASPEPFPLHIVGPDGASRVWECLPRGFVSGDIEGWIITLTCRREQNPSIAAMDCFVSGGTPLDIAVAVANRYHENSRDGWRKSALVLHRSEHPDNGVSPWRAAPPPAGTDPVLAEALELCLNDSTALWNRLAPGSTASGCDLPDVLASAATQAQLPYCTMLATGIADTTRLVFVRLSNFEYELQGNNKLTDQAIDGVLQQAFDAERSRARLNEETRTDPLTGIANRRLFEEVVKATSAAASHAALFVDIDRFKAVNDTFGHSVGDAALREVATRLAGSCRPHDLVARVGGDEFGIVLRDVTAEEVVHITDRIREAMRLPFDLDDGPGTISVTVGVAPPATDIALGELVRRADLAMLAEKAANRTAVV